MSNWTAWSMFSLLGLMWLLVAGNNVAQLIEARRNGGGSSLTLFLGGIFGSAAVVACPIEGAWVWFWLPALMDPGSIPAIFYILRARFAGAKSKSLTNQREKS